MARQATRSDQHQIELEVEPRKVRSRAQEGFGGARDTTALAWNKCCRRGTEIAA